MKKVLTSFEKLDGEIKRLVMEKYPKSSLGEEMIKISQTDTEMIYGVIFKHEDTEYLIKMVWAPIQKNINLDAIIEEMDDSEFEDNE